MSHSTTAVGPAFEISSLSFAMGWAKRRAIRLVVVTDYPMVEEAIEIGVMPGGTPRWCIWRDHTGAIHLDDWETKKFDKLCVSVADALARVARSI